MAAATLAIRAIALGMCPQCLSLCVSAHVIPAHDTQWTTPERSSSLSNQLWLGHKNCSSRASRFPNRFISRAAMLLQPHLDDDAKPRVRPESITKVKQVIHVETGSPFDRSAVLSSTVARAGIHEPDSAPIDLNAFSPHKVTAPVDPRAFLKRKTGAVAVAGKASGGAGEESARPSTSHRAGAKKKRVNPPNTVRDPRGAAAGGG